jgi:hypothetical protein
LSEDTFEQNPLDGLTEEEADRVIDGLERKVEKEKAFLEEAKEQLKLVKAARKTFTPRSEDTSWLVAQAQTQAQAQSADGSGGVGSE